MMGLFDKIKEPIIIKEGSGAKEQLKELELLLETVNDSKIRKSLETEISIVKAGIFGEETILFELKNSHIPMFVLHDLYLEFEGLSAQIDFLIITRYGNFVIECKNLYGNLTIKNTGEFVRTIGNRQEGIYSPVTQSQRHIELIKQMRSSEKGIVKRALFERYFYEFNHSVVVLANPKTILNDKYAPKEIKNQVIRADQLIQYIKKTKSKDDLPSSEKNMEDLANFFLEKHSTCKTDYLEKYRKLIQSAENQLESDIPTVELQKPEQVIPPNTQVGLLCPKCGSEMIRRKATKGNNTGNEFWGCSTFPKCRGIINL